MGGSTAAKLKTKHPVSQVVHSVHTSYSVDLLPGKVGKCFKSI